MSWIRIKNMEFYAHHGHFKEEQIVGNKFLVNLEMKTNMEKASRSDELEDAVNYQAAYMIVKREMELKSKLLENIARRILDSLYNELSGLEEVKIEVSKMNPPVGGKMDCVSVEMGRNSSGEYF